MLYSFYGTTETEITIPDVSAYKQLMFGLWVSTDDHAQFLATAIIPRSTFVVGNRSVKMFGGSTSTWWLVRSIGSNTNFICNRTSATSDGIEIWGVR